MDNKQLNPFEVKAELLSLFEKLKGVHSFEEYQLHFKILDAQEDKNVIVKLLFKELVNIGDNAGLVKFLLIRYCEQELLCEKLWALIKNQMTPNLTKIIALDILRDITSDWSYENCEEYLENPNDLVDADTKRLLTAAIINPEVQIDFLDFLNSLGKEDRLTLVSSLADDYSNDELANVLIPVFLSEPNSEVGKKALELLGDSKSQLAYHALNTFKGVVGREVSSLIKKSISALKLSGIREDNSKVFYEKLLSESKPYRFCATFPDGMGNMSLIFSRRRKGGKIQFVAVVVNDSSGIKDCFGFNEISKFECDTIIDRFYRQEKAIDLKPEVMKYILESFEKLSKSSKIPYEYVCWKNILADIDCVDIDIKTELGNSLQKQKITLESFEKALQENFLNYWFLPFDYSDEFELFLETLNTRLNSDVNFDIDSLIDEQLEDVFYEEEKKTWFERVLLCAYLLMIEGRIQSAETFYSIYFDEKYCFEFLKFIIRKSIYEYYVSLRQVNNDVFAQNEIDDIVKNIEKKWVNSDV